MDTPARPRGLGRRAFALSVASVAICLPFAAAATAATQPPPSPHEPAVSVSPPRPVHQVVKLVSKTTGIPDPLTAQDGDTRHHHQKSGSTGRLGAGWRPGPAHRTPPGSWTDTTAAPLPAGLVRAAPSSDAVTASATAGRVVPPTAAGSSQAFGHAAASALRVLGQAADSAPRLIAVILGTMVISFLAGGHIKHAQDRLAALDL
jgi:hypothetical protein